jgi:type VI secretion system protein ImpF
VADPKLIVGARPLLFDRLIDFDRIEDEEQSPQLTDGDERKRRVRWARDERERPLQFLDQRQLKTSVRRELERLLNTRCSIPLHRLAEEERSVVNYGIPDFSSLSRDNADDRALIGSIVGQTITAFEPRLRQVSVEVLPVSQTESSLQLNINAELRVGAFSEPVSFPVTLNSKSGTAKTDDSE